jgi:exopolyphosphatase / guanosine-5'-triphosphate,3'-diphosphate pyrophosphatase
VSARWEWRCFGTGFGAAEDRLAEHAHGPAEESDDRYLLSAASDASVKVRSGLMDVKHLLAVDEDGLEQWTPVMKAPFPLAAAAFRAVLDTLRVEAPRLERSTYPQEQLVAEIAGANPEVLALDVRKRRMRCTIGGCMAEVSEMITDRGSTRTIAIEAEDPAAVKAAVLDLGLDPHENTCMARGLKVLAGFGARRYAVIDVGTNSVKFHVGERRADGRWRTIADRAEVTRLGEGLQATRALSPAPIERTVAAICGMADEASRDGAEAIAAVGTAGLRIASNASDLLEAAVSRCGVRVEVIPGDEEARLAYLAATAGIASGDGSRVVFDTGGGSSQFTFGAGDRVEERFSVEVGAARFTEQFGLSGAVSESTLPRP